MGDYISRDVAIARLTKVEVTNRLATMTDAKREIAEMPAADVAPVVHGEWEAVDWREYDAHGCEVICYPKDGIACTHCRYVFKKDALWKKNFCPNCGAKMDGGAEMAEYIDKVEYCEKHCRCSNGRNTEAGQRWAAQEAAAPKPMTNGDRIRAMPDEELAESDELLSGLCNVLHGQGYPCEANTCRECLIKWLGSPEKEANDGQ